MDENGTPCPNVVIWNAAQQSGWSCWNADHTVGWWSWSGLLSKHLGTQRHGFPKGNWWASDGNCYRQKCCPEHVHCTVPSWQVKFNSFAPVSLGSLTCESGLRWWLLVSDALADVGCIVVFFKQTHGPTLHPIQQQRIAIACHGTMRRMQTVPEQCYATPGIPEQSDGSIRFPSVSHPFPIRFPSVSHPFPIRFPSVSHPFPIRFPHIQCENPPAGPATFHPSALIAGQQRLRRDLNIQFYFMREPPKKKRPFGNGFYHP